MSDTMNPQTRSALMRMVKQTGTAPEMLVRRELHRRGLRFKVGDRSLPGSPDLIFPRWRVVLFVHGCFWHGHSCKKGRLPGSNIAFWETKISANRERDLRKIGQLKDLGWRVHVIWECELRGIDFDDRMDALAESIRTSD